MFYRDRYTRLMLLFLLAGIFNPLMADEEIKNIGIPFISNYSPKEYNFERQTWGIDIDPNGLVYFANGALLVSGNRYWRRYDPGNGRSLRCVHSLGGDTVLVGGRHEIGMFVPGEIPGELIYHSLMSRLDSNFHDFGTIWQIEESGGRTFLRGGSAVFEYRKDTLVPLLSSVFIEYMGFVHDTMYVQVAQQGLGMLIDGRFKLLSYGNFFSDIKLRGIFSTGPSEFMIFTDDRGIYRVIRGKLLPYNPGWVRNLAEDQISVVRMINHRYFAVGTVKEGVFIVDTQGNLIQHIDKLVGLQNNTVISMLPDPSSNLWLGLDNGISFIELNSCLSKINSEPDIGTGYVSVYHKGNLYLGTNQGLFYTPWDRRDMDNNRTLDIRPVKNTAGQVWCMFITGGRLYCGHHKGIFLVENGSARIIDQNEGCWELDSLSDMPGTYLESAYRGYFILRADDNGVLAVKKKLTGLPSSARTFQQDEMGGIWMVTAENRIFRFRIDPERLEVEQFQEFTDEPGMPDYQTIKMVGNHRRVFFSTDSGMYHYSREYNRFVNNEYYDEMIGIGKICYEFFEDNYDRIWYVKADEVGYISLHFGKPEKTYLPFTRIYDSYTKIFGSICVLDEDNILFGVDEGFYHYKSSCRENKEIDHKAFITKFDPYQKPVSWSIGREGLFYVPSFLHKKNAFSFNFTCNIYPDPENVYYRYQLEGQDENWSDWTTRNIKEYNNLTEGKYTFKVIARNKYGLETHEARYTFEVRPPYYRTTFAYLLYGAMLIALMLILRYLRTKQIESEKKKIEEHKQQELEEKRKSYEEDKLKAREHITALVNEKLEQDLMHKSRELSNSTFNLLRKNEMLQGMKTRMQHLYLEKNLKMRDQEILDLMRMIEKEINTRKDWEVFDSHFNAVHEDFLNKLRKQYPGLNQNDQRLCTFLKMNKSTKEIATLMNMSVRGVETSRYRLRKKMGLSRSENLYEIISGI